MASRHSLRQAGRRGAAVPPPLRRPRAARRPRVAALDRVPGAGGARRMSVAIRPAVPADAAWLAALAERTFRETYTAHNTPENMERYVATHFGPVRQEAELRDPRMTT